MKVFIGIILSIILYNCYAFNLDELNPIIKKGPSKSMFGTSVAQYLYKQHNKSLSNAVLLVGAPKYNFNKSLGETGTIFKCAMSSKVDDCQSVYIGGSAYLNNSNKSMTHEQFLGFSLEAQKAEGLIATCAHLWHFIEKDSYGKYDKKISGKCFLLNMTEDSTQIQANYTTDQIKDMPYSRNDGKYFCQLGTSVAFGENDVYFGAPGCYDRRGTVLAVDTSAKKLEPKTLNSYSWAESYSNVGYAIAASKHQSRLVATGAPRYSDAGCVFVIKLDSKFEKTQTLCTKVVAASFGSSLEFADLNGDGLDDLIVGSPYQYNSTKQHQGAVFVYYQVNKSSKFIFNKIPVAIYGSPNSNFGISIQNLADLNKDGFDDIAIGASSDDGGFGTVSIFYGKKSTSQAFLPSQIIKGRNLKEKFPDKVGNLTGFGYSLSGGLDMDMNELPDLLVGSTSENVVLLRAKPIIKVLISNLISFKTVGHDLFNKASTFVISWCLDYVSVPSTFNKPIKVNYTLELDTSKSHSRFLFPSNQRYITENILLENSASIKCISKSVQILSQIVDKLSAVKIELKINSVKIKRHSRFRRATTELADLNDFPVLDILQGNNYSIVLDIKNENCGADNICNSSIDFHAFIAEKGINDNTWKKLNESNNMPTLLYESTKEIGILIAVKNTGEEAHQARLRIDHSQELRFEQAVNIKGVGAIYSCIEMEENNKTFVDCDVGNPFSSNSSLILALKFSFVDNFDDIDAINFTVQASTTSEKTAELLPKICSAKIEFSNEISVYGYATEKYETLEFSGQVIGQSSVTKPEDVGNYVIHTYEIENTGFKDVDHTQAMISWPNTLKNQKWLFYFLEVTAEDKYGSPSKDLITCKYNNQGINPLGLKFETKTRKKRSLQSSEKSKERVWDIVCPIYEGCVNIICDVDSIKKQSSLLIYIKAVVWNSTFIEEYGDSHATLAITSNFQLKTYENLTTESNLESFASTSMVNKIIKEKDISKYIYTIIISAIGGSVLLIFIVLVCWKCGFFKRTLHNKIRYHKAESHLTAALRYNEKL